MAPAHPDRSPPASGDPYAAHQEATGPDGGHGIVSVLTSAGRAWMTSGRRVTEQSAHRLGLIRRAKGPGFTLAEMRDLLDAAEGGAAEDILGAARVELGKVEAGLRALRATRCRLTRLVHACVAGEHS